MYAFVQKQLNVPDHSPDWKMSAQAHILWNTEMVYNILLSLQASMLCLLSLLDDYKLSAHTVTWLENVICKLILHR